MTDESYVTNDAWLSIAERKDTIDEIADQFERPVACGAAAFWDDVTVRRVVRETSLVPRTVERRAG
jgi:hypothetical protein